MPKSVLSGNFAADGSSAALDISGYQRKEFSVGVAGTWGGGTVSVEVAADDPPTAWAPLYSDSNNAISLTADGVKQFTLTARRLRLTLAGATGPDLDYEVFH